MQQSSYYKQDYQAPQQWAKVGPPSQDHALKTAYFEQPRYYNPIPAYQNIHTNPRNAPIQQQLINQDPRSNTPQQLARSQYMSPPPPMGRVVAGQQPNQQYMPAHFLSPTQSSPMRVSHSQQNQLQSSVRRPQYQYSTTEAPIQQGIITSPRGPPPPQRNFTPPRYSDVYPRGYRAEILPYQYERPILSRESVPVGVDRPQSYARNYDIYRPYHRQPNECKNEIHSEIVENQDIKPHWIEWRGVEEFAYMLKEMIVYELRAERLRIDLSIQPDFNIGALYTKILNSSKQSEHAKELSQEKACDKPLYFNDFLTACQYFNIDPEPWDLQLLMNRFKKFVRQEKSEVSMEYKDFYQLFYPVSKKELFEQKLNQLDMYTEHFTSKTQAMIEELIRVMLSQEDAYDYFRRELKRRDIELERVWMKINPAKRHDIQLENFRCFLMDYGFHFSREEINLILLRYDKCRLGTVNFVDFREELLPRIDIQTDDKDYYTNNLDQQLKENAKF